MARFGRCCQLCRWRPQTSESEYKKSKVTITDGRGQHPFLAKEGKEDTDNMRMPILSALRMDNRCAEAKGMVTEGICGHTWMTGYMPDREFGSVVTKGAACPCSVPLRCRSQG